MKPLREEFDSITRILNDFLREPGQTCFVPAYQRPYTWARKDFEKLFDDMLRFIDNMLSVPYNNKGEYQMLGTAIVLDNKDAIPIKQEFRKYLTGSVMTIIDGQQRISTLTLINIILHNKLSVLFTKVNKSLQNKKFEEDVEIQYLIDYLDITVKEILEKLVETFLTDKRIGEDCFRYYPKIVRAYEDISSFDEKIASYNSPLGNLIFAYNKHIYENKIQTTKWKPESSKFFHNYKRDNINISGFFNAIEKIITDIIKRKIIKENVTEFILPDLNEMMDNTRFSKNIGVNNDDENFSTYFKSIEKLKIENKTLFNNINDLLSIIYLSKFIDTRVVVNFLTVTNEQVAYNLYESINTTGVLLTSFETLIPKVVEAETKENDDYEHSISKVFIDNINYYALLKNYFVNLIGIYH